MRQPNSGTRAGSGGYTGMPVPPPAEPKIPYAAPVSRRDLACSRLPRGAVTEKGGDHEDAAGRAASDNHGQPGPATSQPSAPHSAGTRTAPAPRSLSSHGACVACLLLRHDHGSPARYAGRAPPCDLARDLPERIRSAVTSGRKGGHMEYQERAAGRPGHYAGWAGSPVIPHRGPAGPDGPCSAGAVDDT